MNIQGMGCKRFCGQVSLSVGVPLGTQGGGLFAGNCDSRRRGPEMERLFLQEVC